MKLRKESLVCEEKYPRERKNELVVQLQYSRIVSEMKAKLLSLDKGKVNHCKILKAA